MATSASEPPAMDVSKLSFQEFHAVRNRKRGQETPLKTGDFIPIQRSSREICGESLEYFQTQFIVVTFILLDVISVAIEMYMYDKGLTHVSTLSSVLIQLLESFTGFTIMFFLFELGVALYAFQLLFFTHIGYLLDLTSVLTALYYELMHQSKAARLLGIFRLWRAVRMVNSLLDAEQVKHNRTKGELEKEREKNDKLKTEKRVLEKAVENEIEGKRQIEQTLRGYKDEIETLKEALNIAASSVARASMEEFGYLTQDELVQIARDEEEEEEEYQDAI